MGHCRIAFVARESPPRRRRCAIAQGTRATSTRYLFLIVPTLCVGMHPVTLCVTFQKRNAERPWRHSHAGAWERSICIFSLKNHRVAICSMRACSRWAAQQPQSQSSRCIRWMSSVSWGALRTPAGASSLATEPFGTQVDRLITRPSRVSSAGRRRLTTSSPILISNVRVTLRLRPNRLAVWT